MKIKNQENQNQGNQLNKMGMKKREEENTL
jgi:hypothetical protein